MSQLPLFEGATQTHPPTQSRSAGEAQIARPRQPQSKIPKIAHQPPLLAPPAATAQSIAPPPAAAIAALPADSLPPDPLLAKALPPGWVDPADPAFNCLKNCRLCGWLIKIGGLDHSLCSADCGWVVDLQWLAWMEAHRRKRKEPEPQAATHTDSSETKAFDLFSYGLDRDTSVTDGGVA